MLQRYSSFCQVVSSLVTLLTKVPLVHLLSLAAWPILGSVLVTALWGTLKALEMVLHPHLDLCLNTKLYVISSIFHCALHIHVKKLLETEGT